MKKESCNCLPFFLFFFWLFYYFVYFVVVVVVVCFSPNLSDDTPLVYLFVLSFFVSTLSRCIKNQAVIQLISTAALCIAGYTFISGTTRCAAATRMSHDSASAIYRSTSARFCTRTPALPLTHDTIRWAGLSIA